MSSTPGCINHRLSSANMPFKPGQSGDPKPLTLADIRNAVKELRAAPQMTPQEILQRLAEGFLKAYALR